MNCAVHFAFKQVLSVHDPILCMFNVGTGVVKHNIAWPIGLAKSIAKVCMASNENLNGTEQNVCHIDIRPHSGPNTKSFELFGNKSIHIFI